MNVMALPAGIVESLRILKAQRALSDRFHGRPPASEAPSMEETLERAVRALERTGVPWVLVGGHAVNLYVRPRATVDFDFVVDGRRLKTVVEALRAEFGPLTERSLGPAVRLEEVAIDLIRSDSHAVFRRALERAVERDGLRVVPPEVLVALKYHAAIGIWRDPEDRKLDASDLIRIYRALGDDFDREAAIELAGTAYPGADKEFRDLLDRIDRGEKLEI